MTQPASVGLWQRLCAFGQGEGLRAQLLRGGFGSIAVKAGHALIAFTLAVLLARTLGPDGYGVYSFALALLMLAAIPAQVGVPQLLVRETAKAQAQGDWRLMRGLWRWGNAAVLTCSLVALALIAVVLASNTVALDEERVVTLAAGLALVPLIALANVRAACLRGLRLVVRGQLPESVLRPALLLLLLFFATTWAGADDTLSPETAMGLHALAAAVTFIIGTAMLWKARPDGLQASPTPVYEHRAWRRSVLPLALITGLQVINNHADLIILGLLRTDEEVGVYRAVFQAALLIIFGLQAMNQVLQPHFARLYARGEHGRLQRLVTASARAILALALPPVALFLLFGEGFLALVFGEEFRAGGLALAILAGGQLANAAVGPVGMLLNMTGHERDTMQGILIAAVGNVVLNLALIPPFGMEGAAVASALTLVLWNMLLRRSVRKRLGLETLATGPVARSR